MMKQTKKVVVVGGGTAGWLTAALIAARFQANMQQGFSVTLIESPETPTVGVGEGTWPTMRKTLQRIGIDETDFLMECDASFKQGSRFDAWVNGEPADSYLHPFEPPISSVANDLFSVWQNEMSDTSFATSVCAQPAICAKDLAPKQKNMPGYAGALNYAYHLDAVKLADLLMRHATAKLGVDHICDHVRKVVSAEDGDISAVETRKSGAIDGDLFIDCTGQASVLLGKHYGVGFKDQSSVLFNDRALAVQIPIDRESDPIASQTISTAHDAGWIWDIGLPTRRGVGCVYSSRHASEVQAAETLDSYVRSTAPHAKLDRLDVRKLRFQSGHREYFWHRNCVAIGLSAGFLEPLEASAIVLIELSADALVEDFPVDRKIMDVLAKRFNQLFLYRWGRIIDFLKLHYVLSKRTQKYWQDNRSETSMTEQLTELLAIWRHRPPSQRDFPAIDEIFPAASYQYILYGMGFKTACTGRVSSAGRDEAMKQMRLVEQRVRTYGAGLPSNRALLNMLKTNRNTQRDVTGGIAENV